MRQSTVWALVVAAAATAGIAWFNAGSLSKDAGSPTAAKSKTISADALPTQAVLRIRPGSTSVAAAPGPALAHATSADVQQLRDKRDWPGLFQRVKNGPQTPEAMWLTGELMRACARGPAGAAPGPGGPGPAASPEERRKRFLSGVPDNDPQRAQRIAAFEKLTVDACGELAAMGFTRDDAKKFTAQAAEAGYPRARAEALADDIQRASREAQEKEASPGGGPRGGGRMVVTDEQLAAMQELLKTGDPGVLAELRNVLASTWRDSVVQLGPDRETVDSRAMMAAMQLLGCDLGSPCDANSPSVLSRCAYQNQCGASSLPDQVYYYDASPHQAQLVDRYRQSLLEMMRTGDFSNLRVARGVQNAGNVFIFGSTRGP